MSEETKNAVVGEAVEDHHHPPPDGRRRQEAKNIEEAKQNTENLCKTCGQSVIGLPKKPKQIFTCEKCPDRIFKTKSALTVHKKTHEDRTKYNCEQCKKQYIRQSALEAHIKKKH